jgi:hypothetical protein
MNSPEMRSSSSDSLCAMSAPAAARSSSAFFTDAWPMGYRRLDRKAAYRAMMKVRPFWRTIESEPPSPSGAVIVWVVRGARGAVMFPA